MSEIAAGRIVEGGGLKFWTEDPFLRRAVERCGELERENIELRHEMTARYRTLRRDVSQIKRKVCSNAV